MYYEQKRREHHSRRRRRKRWRKTSVSSSSSSSTLYTSFCISFAVTATAATLTLVGNSFSWHEARGAAAVRLYTKINDRFLSVLIRFVVVLMVGCYMRTRIRTQTHTDTKAIINRCPSQWQTGRDDETAAGCVLSTDFRVATHCFAIETVRLPEWVAGHSADLAARDCSRRWDRIPFQTLCLATFRAIHLSERPA